MSNGKEYPFTTSYAIGWFPYFPLVCALILLLSILVPGSTDGTATQYVDNTDALMQNFTWIAGCTILVATLFAWDVSRRIEGNVRRKYQLSSTRKWTGCLWMYMAVNLGLLLLLSPIIGFVGVQYYVELVGESDFFVVDGEMVDSKPRPGWYWENELEEQGIRAYQYGEHQFAYYRAPDSNSYQLSINVALYPNEEAWAKYKDHSIELQRHGQHDYEWLEQLLKQWLMDEDANRLYKGTIFDGPIPQQYRLHVAVEEYIAPHLENAGMTLVSARKQLVH